MATLADLFGIDGQNSIANPKIVNVGGAIDAYNQGQSAFYKQRQIQGLEQLAPLLQGGDLGKAAAAAMATGNQELANNLLQLHNTNTNQRFNQGMAQQQFGLQQQQFANTQQQQASQNRMEQQRLEIAQRQARQKSAPHTIEVDTASGQKATLQWDAEKNTYVPVQAQAPTQQSGGNPYATGKFNGEQGKAAGFADRMMGSELKISTPEATDAATSYTQAAYGALPEIAGNALKSTARQSVEQSQRDFINAILRRESGAVISPEEFNNARQQYFPQPGNPPEVIAQKAQNRRTVIEAMAREAGNAYKPKYIYGEDGKLQPYGDNKPQQGGSGQQGGKTVVKTGTYKGRKVNQFSDGSFDYAD